MSNLALLDEHLRTLRLPAMLANYRRIADDDGEKVMYLQALAALEVDRRHENGVRARIAAAHFPVVKTMESFDFSLQPNLPKAKLFDLLDGRFIAEHINPILVGPTGVGKTHALTAIGLAACAAGYRVLFTTAAELCMNLIAAKREDRLKQRIASYERYQLLQIDELGYIPFEREATDLLYQIIAQRYERASIALTTNLAFTDWTQVFPDPMTASVVVDRLVHHSIIFEFTGESHRLRTRQAAAAARSRKGA
jgi:DNA replication protein DnaC